MRRGAFLKRAVGALVATRFGTLPETGPAVTLLEPESIAPLVLTAPKAALDSIQLVASGGFCAPLTPYYDIAVGRPLRDSMPDWSKPGTFRSQRGQ